MARCLRTTSVLARASVALGLVAASLLVAGSPAQAVGRHELMAPARGGTMTGAFTVAAEVEARLDHVDGVQVRLLRNGLPYGPVQGLRHADGRRDAGGTSRWVTDLDPLRSWAAGGGPMHNGAYRFEINVTSSGPGGGVTGWTGHDAVIDVGPPSVGLTAQVVSHSARSVEVSWDATAVPDFRRYVVQRAGGGSWADVATLTTSTTTRFVDVAPAPGSYQYRVVVVRAAANGGDSTSTSPERTVVVDAAPTGPLPEDETQPPSGDPGGGQPAPGGTPTPGPGDGPAPGGTGDGPPSDGGATPGDSAGESPAADGEAAPGGRYTRRGFRSSGSGAPPAGSGANVPAIAGEESAPRPQVGAPEDDGTFAEVLPFETEREIVERRVDVRRGETIEGGTLSIYNRELALEEVMPPLAGGLLLFVVAGHVLRLRRD